MLGLFQEHDLREMTRPVGPEDSGPRKGVLCAAALSLFAVSSPALAQTSSEKAASAQALFDEGQRLMSVGQPAAACPKFAASQKLDPGMGTKFRLADCYEKIGKTASAWALFLEISDEARGAKRPEREEIVRKRAADLAPKLARMTVLVAPDSVSLAGLEIRRDGTVLDKAIWGVAAPVDPGEHMLTATAPGKLAWENKSVVAQPSKTIEVTIPRLEDQPKAPVVVAAVPLESPMIQRRSLVPVALFGGVAVVAAAVGGALLGVAGGKASDARDQAAVLKGSHCIAPPGTNTNAACITLIDTINSSDGLHNAGVGLFVGAGVAGVAAVTYLLLPPSAAKKASSTGVRATPMVGPGSAALLVSGSF